MTAQELTASRPRTAKEEKPLLLFFYSPTSGPSRRLDGLVSCLYVRERSRLRLRKIDLSEQSAIAEKLSVTTVPTLVLVKGRRIVAQLEGKVTGRQLRDAVVPHLAL